MKDVKAVAVPPLPAEIAASSVNSAKNLLPASLINFEKIGRSNFCAFILPTIIRGACIQISKLILSSQTLKGRRATTQ